ncbi:hypothetical protein EV360DRAFT_65939 [Lentinula raphanica]|nr:hypothetical protein EV360DRAFT_65939 [Lentinula raphanica]
MSWCEMAQVVVASILILSSLSRGQTTNATCDPSFSWADNSNQQSPCLVTALLEGLCDPLGVQVPALPASNHYLGPSPGQATTCEYREWITWDEWKQECSIVELGIFPLQIPTTIDVPSWAYINISMVNGTFDVAAAQNNATLSQPISTSGNSSSFTTSTQPSSTPTSSSDPLPATPTSSSPSTATSQPSSKSLAGAIAGGTIGGFAVIMILGLALLWFLTKPKRRTNNSKVVSPATTRKPIEGGPRFNPPQGELLAMVLIRMEYPIICTLRDSSDSENGENPTFVSFCAAEHCTLSSDYPFIRAFLKNLVRFYKANSSCFGGFWFLGSTASTESSSMDPATTAQASGGLPTTILESLDSTTQSKPNHTDVVLPVTLVIVFLVILCLGLLYVFRRRWLRRNRFFGKPYPDSPVATPSILSFSAGFSVNSDDHQSGYKAIPNPYTYYIPPPALVRSTSPQLSVSTSLLSLPRSLYEPTSAVTLSPAVPSSEYTNMGQSVEHAMVEGRLADRKPLKLVPVRRVDSGDI